MTQRRTRISDLGPLPFWKPDRIYRGPGAVGAASILPFFSFSCQEGMAPFVWSRRWACSLGPCPRRRSLTFQDQLRLHRLVWGAQGAAAGLPQQVGQGGGHGRRRRLASPLQHGRELVHRLVRSRELVLRREGANYADQRRLSLKTDVKVPSGSDDRGV